MQMPLAAIISKPQKPELRTILPELITWLCARGYTCIVDPESASYIDAADPIEREDMPEQEPSLVIVLAGTAPCFLPPAPSRRPQFLSSASTSARLVSLPRYRSRRCTRCSTPGVPTAPAIELRSMMRIDLIRDGQPFQKWDALNDAVVAKGAIARMANFTVELDGQFVATFRADGVIVSTLPAPPPTRLPPTDPIVMASVNAMVVTPICPHLLTIRLS